MSAYGQLEDVATALSGLTYTAQSTEFSGTDTIFIEVVDADGLAASRTIKVVVQADIPPKIIRAGGLASLPRNLQMDEDGELALDTLQIIVSNPATESTVSVELFTTTGAVSLSNSDSKTDLRTSYNTGVDVVIAGNTALVNRALRRLIYRPEENTWGSDELSVVAREGRNGSNSEWSAVAGFKSIIIVINPINDAPTIEMPIDTIGSISRQVLAGDILALEGIIIHDADAEEPSGSQLISLNMSTTEAGNMVSLAPGRTTVQGHIPGVRFIEGSAEGMHRHIAVKAPLSAANIVLQLLQFWAPYGQTNGVDTVTIAVSDDGNWGEGMAEVAVATVDVDVQYRQNPLNVAGGPVWWDTPPGALVMDEDSHLGALGITLVTDAFDLTANSTWVTVMIATEYGMMQMAKKVAMPEEKMTTEIVRHDPRSLIVTGAVVHVSAKLGEVTYLPEPDFHGIETLKLTVQGHAGEWTANASVDIVVFAKPDAPTITMSRSSLDDSDINHIVEVGTRLSFHKIIVEHADALHGDQSARVELRASSTAAGKGILAMNNTHPGLWISVDEATRTLVVKGAVEKLQLALDSGALEYLPTGTSYGTDTVTLGVSSTSPFDTPFNGDVHFLDEPESVENATATMKIEVIPLFNPGVVNLGDGALFRTTEGSSVEVSGISVRAPGRQNTSETYVMIQFWADHGRVTLPGAVGRRATVEDQGGPVVSLMGTETEVNIALIGVLFKGTPFYNGVAALKVIGSAQGELLMVFHVW